ncbi:hypothetical protein BAY60_05835 [Prauserella muralis]|uniref:Galactan 5-O-arabinofuranosyltransferase n=1 Tax=Prauserella muralis TaxID=588067 RepID=A0A2V4BMH6_9PSEU|nr:hypothetical protein BAY60_05835 [Prauserella muralis]
MDLPVTRAEEAAPSGRRPSPPLLGPGRFTAELVLAGLLTVLVSLAIQFGVNRLPTLLPGTNVPAALMALAGGVLLVLTFGLLRYAPLQRWPGWLRLAGVWTLLAALPTAVLALRLQTTRFFLGGSSVDNSFRLRYFERMASSAGLNDMNYQGVAPYYPGGWFWLGGRFANLAGLQGWEAYKPYSILWASLSAVLAFVLWSLVVRRRTALLASMATLLAGFVTSGVEEPYAWPTTAWLPPIAVLTWTQLRRRDRAPWWPFVLVAVYLGACAVTYTLHLGFGALLVVLFTVLAGVLAVREGERAGSVVRRLLPRLVLVGALSAVLALVVWAPFILQGGLGEDNAAARFLPSGSAYLPIPFVPDSAFGLLCLAGLVWSVLRARRSPVAFVLLTCAALVYAWFALSTMALAMNTTLLAFRFLATLSVVLAVAGVFGTLELLGYVVRTWRQWRRPVLALAVVLASLGSIALLQDGMRGSLSKVIERAETDYYPSGHTPSRTRDVSDPGAWTGALIRTIDRLGTGEPTDEILLSEHSQVMIFRPYWGFHELTPHYANPLGRYKARSAEVRTWAASTSPDQLWTRMHDGPFEPAPTMLVLRREPDGSLRYTIKYDTFPRKIPVAGDPVTFDPALFDSPRFERRDVGPYTVIALR